MDDHANKTQLTRFSTRHKLAFIATIVLLLNSSFGLAQSSSETAVLIYSATPAGISAAVAAAAEGQGVLLIEPTNRIGGLVTSGLSHTDFHSRESLSGAFLNFSQRVEAYYGDAYGPDSPQVKDCDGGVFAEPKVNLAVFEKILSEWRTIKVLYQHELKSVAIDSGKLRSHIRSVTFSDANGALVVISPKIVIDASYEGDLMAMAGVPWRAGREGQGEYDESLAPEEPDDQLQAYNFRFIMTRDPANRVTPQAPAGYRREEFLDVLVALKSGQIDRIFDYPRKCIFKAHQPPLPNGKFDINDVSGGLVRLSLPGQNLKWPNGTAIERQQIYAEHLRDQVGLLYFLQNDEAVPEEFRREAQEWGWCRDEFTDTDYLPPQLYVREARRMIGRRVFTQRDSEHAPGDARAVLHPDSIAMGDYGNNCHGTFHEGPRFAGKHSGEFYNPVPPYQIPYGTVIPNDVENLLVPTAASSSHVGFCALRLEPIWMSLGQATGHAAAISIQNRLAVQDVPIVPLQQRLHAESSATVYVSDVLPGHPDFAAVQWWGTLGGLHGLAPMPDKPGQRGKNLHGQYFEANPGHTADLNAPLSKELAERWTALAIISGLSANTVPDIETEITRGDFIREAYSRWRAAKTSTATEVSFRLHSKALPNTHAAGEVDEITLIPFIITDLQTLPGIVLDDSDAELTGEWQYSSHTPPFVGRGYLHDRNTGKGGKSATFRPSIPAAGKYEVRLSHCYNIRRATNTTVTIHHADGEFVTEINQQHEPEHGRLFRILGTFPFPEGKESWIRISNAGTEGKYVIVDAVQLLPVD
jgi:hypothetical protein